MSARSWRDRVRDILDAIGEVQSFTAGLMFEQFAADPKAVKAAAMDFIVLGEAAGQIPPDVRAAHPEIPWDIMRGMRNRLVHAYFAIDSKIVWDTIQDDLPPLIDPLQQLLGAEDDSGD